MDHIAKFTGEMEGVSESLWDAFQGTEHNLEMAHVVYVNGLQENLIYGLQDNLSHFSNKLIKQTVILGP